MCQNNVLTISNNPTFSEYMHLSKFKMSGVVYLTVQWGLYETKLSNLTMRDSYNFPIALQFLLYFLCDYSMVRSLLLITWPLHESASDLPVGESPEIGDPSFVFCRDKIVLFYNERLLQFPYCSTVLIYNFLCDYNMVTSMFLVITMTEWEQFKYVWGRSLSSKVSLI